jgi:hypothetical protein
MLTPEQRDAMLWAVSDPAAKNCERSEGAGGGQSGSYGRGTAEAPLGNFAAVQESGSGSAPRRRESSVEEESTRRVVD